MLSARHILDLQSSAGHQTTGPREDQRLVDRLASFLKSPPSEPQVDTIEARQIKVVGAG